MYSELDHHFLAQLEDAKEPVVTDVKKVVRTLNSLCAEMDARYDLLKIAKVRNIKQYLLAAIYNAPLTMQSYYQAWVNNDMAEGRI